METEPNQADTGSKGEGGMDREALQDMRRFFSHPLVHILINVSFVIPITILLMSLATQYFEYSSMTDILWTLQRNNDLTAEERADLVERAEDYESRIANQSPIQVKFFWLLNWIFFGGIIIVKLPSRKTNWTFPNPIETYKSDMELIRKRLEEGKGEDCWD